MSTAVTTHIRIDENGVAWVDDARIKVIEVAIDKIAHGSSPEEMHFQYPRLSLAQIHAALAHYYDHQTENYLTKNTSQAQRPILAPCVS